MKKNKTMIVTLIVLSVVIVFSPLFLLKGSGAEFGGSDGAGSDMVTELTGGAHEPWFTPVLETLIGGGLPGEVETLIFCVQTGIGVGIMAYCFGFLVARKKYSGGKE